MSDSPLYRFTRAELVDELARRDSEEQNGPSLSTWFHCDSPAWEMRPIATGALAGAVAMRDELEGGNGGATVKRWCDECRHFPSTNCQPRRDNPAARISCAGRSHPMSFRMPESCTEDGWGFYRRGCRDFSAPES